MLARAKRRKITLPQSKQKCRPKVMFGTCHIDEESLASFDIALELASVGGLQLDDGVRDACEIVTHLLAVASERSRQLAETLGKSDL